MEFKYETESLVQDSDSEFAGTDLGGSEESETESEYESNVTDSEVETESDTSTDELEDEVQDDGIDYDKTSDELSSVPEQDESTPQDAELDDLSAEYATSSDEDFSTSKSDVLLDDVCVFRNIYSNLMAIKVPELPTFWSQSLEAAADHNFYDNPSNYIVTSNYNIVSKKATIYNTKAINVYAKSIIDSDVVIRAELLTPSSSNVLYGPATIRIGKYVSIMSSTVISPVEKFPLQFFMDNPDSFSDFKERLEEEAIVQTSKSGIRPVEKKSFWQRVGCLIQDNVVIERNSLVQASRISPNSIILPNCKLSSNSNIQSHTVVYANSVVPKNAVLAPFSLYAGVPAERRAFIGAAAGAIHKQIAQSFYSQFMYKPEKF